MSLISDRKFQRYFKLAIGGLCAALLIGCSSDSKFQGSHQMKTEERQLKAPFTKILLQIPCDINIHTGDKQSMKIELDDNLLPLVFTDTTGDTLTISSKERFSKAKCRIDITCPHLTALSIDGAAQANIDQVKEDSFTVVLAGAGDVNAAGECDKVKIEIKGAGNVDLRNLKAKDALVEIKGAGNGLVYATDSINATISGAGSIKYKGSPAKVEKNIAGIGSIAPL